MDDLFRLSGGKPHEPAIDAWLMAQSPHFGEIARHWFGRFRAAGDGDVRELMHDGCPTASVEDAALGYVNVFRAHVNVGFYRGDELPDPERLLEGRGRHMRHVKLRPGEDGHEAALEAQPQHLRQIMQQARGGDQHVGMLWRQGWRTHDRGSGCGDQPRGSRRRGRGGGARDVGPVLRRAHVPAA